MSTTTRAYTPSMQFLDENGKPLVGGFLCTYKAGTTTPIATLNDNGLPNQVKIPLNELGSPANGRNTSLSFCKQTVRPYGQRTT